ncbi:hypothetical protein VNO78_16594 [Psophocarpus tetragonolobus]|uniref:NAC domain-containing protein n=1 Tax=Psophocarpus tetragonolobus TaxID=3891 RepID=A0AAN9XKK9_PSOTE
MEVLNPIEGKNYKLPVGYRFDPTDDVLAGYYLWKKILGQPIPNDLIQDCDVYQTVPWELPGGGQHLNWHRFFFYDVRANVFENPDERNAGNGQWRTLEKGQHVELSNNLQVAGKKNILVFWKPRGNRLVKTNWFMHEFRLSFKPQPSKMSFLTVCRIFEEGRRTKRAKSSNVEAVTGIEQDIEGTPIVIDFKMEPGTVTQPPSPGTP